MHKVIVVVAIVFGLALEGNSAPAPILKLFEKLKSENMEVLATHYSQAHSEQGVKGAKARLWPSLTLQAVANESNGSGTATVDNDPGTSSPDDSLDGQGSSTSNTSSVETPQRGWTAQLSASYFLFAQFAISENIQRARNSLQKSKYVKSEEWDKKRSQVIQLLLEWQALKKIVKKLDQASGVIGGVQKFRKKHSGQLYSRKDRANLNEKQALIDYHRVEAGEGLKLVESGLIKMFRTLTVVEINKLPKIEVHYELPPSEKIEELFIAQSRSKLKSDLDVTSMKGYYRATRWDRPWVPIVVWSAGYSTNGDFQGQSTEPSASTTIGFRFNVFDGFYSSARREQARIGVELAKIRSQVEGTKRVLRVKHQRMKSVVASAKAKHKKTQAEKKRLRMQDLERNHKKGIGTRLEVSLGRFDYAKLLMETLDAEKESQQASLNVAIELNDWGKVNVYEKK